MTFFKIKRKKVNVTCKCGAKYEIDQSSIYTSETDIKGRLCFYTYCKQCEKLIFFEEKDLPRKYVKQLYKNHIWFG